MAGSPRLVLAASPRTEVAIEADPHIQELPPSAGYFEHAGCEPRIGGDERVLDFCRRKGLHTLGRCQSRRNGDAPIEVTRHLEIALGAQPGAGAVAAVFVNDQILAR